MIDILIRGDRVATLNGTGAWDIAISGEKIHAVTAPGTINERDVGRRSFCARRNRRAGDEVIHRARNRIDRHALHRRSCRPVCRRAVHDVIRRAVRVEAAIRPHHIHFARGIHR